MNKEKQEKLIEKDSSNITLYEYLYDSKLFNLMLYQLDYIKEGLRRKYLTLINKYGKFRYDIAETKNGYIYHVRIPSESITNLKYDVIIELVSKEEKSKLQDYEIKLFCNSPSFTFTFAYVMNQNGLFAEDYKDLIDKEFLTRPPIEKNIGMTIGYEKLTFMALQFLIDSELFDKKVVEKDKHKLTQKEIHNNVSDVETKYKELSLKRKAMTEQDKYLRRKTKAKDIKSKVTSHTSVEAHNKSKKDSRFMNGGKSVIKPNKAKTKVTPKKKITGKRKIGR